MPIMMIDVTEEQANALARGESVTIISKEPSKKWEPQFGRYFVDTNGQVLELQSGYGRRLFGLEYPTREKAERAAALMRSYHRMVAYALEHWPDYDMKPGSSIWGLVYNELTKKWCATHTKYNRCFIDPWTPYGPEDKVKELVDKLNSGEVEL